MSPSARRRRWRICRGWLTPKPLLLTCLLDGEVYGTSRVNPNSKLSVEAMREIILRAIFEGNVVRDAHASRIRTLVEKESTSAEPMRYFYENTSVQATRYLIENQKIFLIERGQKEQALLIVKTKSLRKKILDLMMLRPLFNQIVKKKL